jgi:hypothetical protein
MRSLVVLCAAVADLAAVPFASSGGWATVGFAPLPDGTSAGGTWTPDIFVKQHGVTPLEGLTPVVEITNDDTGASETFVAADTSEPGVYTADVVFPSEGDWQVTVRSGFGDSNVTYGPVAIGAAPGVGGGESRELPVVGLGAIALVLAAGIAVLLGRRSRRLTPASG